MKNVTIDDILYRVNRVIQSEVDLLRVQFKSARVDYISGHARFEDDHQVSIIEADGPAHEKITKRLRASKFLVACGTRPAHNPNIPIDGKVIFDSDQILSWNIRQLPRSLIVVGAGVIGMEYASMLNVIRGHSVTVIDGREEILSFCDDEIISTLTHEMRNHGARFLLGETIESVDKSSRGVLVGLKSGKKVHGDALLYVVGRQANTDGLNLEAAGLSRNPRGLLSVNTKYQTKKPHIFAVGDCIGAPSLASTSMEQGRLASCYMWNEDESNDDSIPSQLKTGNFPYGIYTIPEISMVGHTEKQLTSQQINYEIGVAKYSELAKGQMSGASADGMLKILFDPHSLKLFGVHAIGEGATEIIHIGQVAIAMGATLTYFRDAVFNYPTLAEAYRVAALNGLGRLRRGDLSDDVDSYPLAAVTKNRKSEYSTEFRLMKASTDQVLRKGVLFKKGSGHGPFGRKNWKPRYFVLRPHTLSYYTFEDGELKGELDISSCDETALEIMPADSMKTGSSASTIWRVAINAAERRLLVAASTEMEMNNWVDKFLLAFRINSGMSLDQVLPDTFSQNSPPVIRNFQNFSSHNIHGRRSTGDIRYTVESEPKGSDMKRHSIAAQSECHSAPDDRKQQEALLDMQRQQKREAREKERLEREKRLLDAELEEKKQDTNGSEHKCTEVEIVRKPIKRAAEINSGKTSPAAVSQTPSPAEYAF
ncbi:unnamed protein product [Albugo candida]|nr:unnamed protein product [Albugo candida]|eukprot:CCI50814.1 unnamed protein product [Albugo candida]